MWRRSGYERGCCSWLPNSPVVTTLSLTLHSPRLRLWHRYELRLQLLLQSRLQSWPQLRLQSKPWPQ